MSKTDKTIPAVSIGDSEPDTLAPQNEPNLIGFDFADLRVFGGEAAGPDRARRAIEETGAAALHVLPAVSSVPVCA